MFPKIVVAFLLLGVFNTSAYGNERKIEKHVLDNILLPTYYDKNIMPSVTNTSDERPLDVLVNLYVSRFNKIDDEKQVFSLTTTFRREWVDKRLKYGKVPGIDGYINLNNDEKIWTPDTFFNDLKAYHHDIPDSNTLVRIYDNGTILLSKRYTLVLNCDMDFTKFPFDEQICELKIESYTSMAKDILFKWKGEHPVDITDSIRLPFHHLKKYDTKTGHINTKSGVYSYLSLQFTFKRNIYYYLVNIFIPCTMLVFAGYVSFWIDVKHFTARMILVTTTLYTVCMQTSNINLEIPKASYTKAIDLYTGICITFVFITLIETTYAGFEAGKKDDDLLISKNINGGATNNMKKDDSKVKQIKGWVIENSSNKIDAAGRVFYPILFFIFQLLFWTVCLSL